MTLKYPLGLVFLLMQLNTLAQTCTLGNYWNTTSSSCQPCPAASYCAGGTAQPVSCPAGTYSTNGTSCLPCPPGSYCPFGAPQPITCPAGNFCSGGTVVPEPCPMGNFCQSGAELPVKCTQGKYQDQIGQETCKDCLPGTYNGLLGATSCILCGVGTYNPNLGAISCQSCPSATTEGSATCAPLAIRSSSFYFSVKNDLVYLNWTVIVEDKISSYELQKSMDGINWVTINRQQSKGVVGESYQYQVIDYFPQDGINYFRLEEVSLDGSSTYSEILKFIFKVESNLKIYPNPITQDKIHVAIDDQQIISLSLIDLSGRIVSRFNFEKTNIASVPLGLLNAGIYMLQITTEDKIYTRKIIKKDE